MALVREVSSSAQGLIVDMLPQRLWRQGNLYLGMRLHFCIGGDEPGRTVRTVEWNGREIARGRRAVDPSVL